MGQKEQDGNFVHYGSNQIVWVSLEKNWLAELWYFIPYNENHFGVSDSKFFHKVKYTLIEV